jgi:hypothetical protein
LPQTAQADGQTVNSKKRFIGCGVHQKSYEQTPQKGVVEEEENFGLLH